MFDISFAELVVVILVLIICVSPKNIPVLARGAGKLTKKVRLFLSDIKKELEREGKLQGIKKY